MTYDYTRLELTASRLIKQFGRTGVLSSPQAAGGGYQSPELPTSFSSIFLVEDRQQNYQQSGSDVSGVTKYLLIESAAPVKVGDLIMDDGAEAFLASPSPEEFIASMKVVQVDPIRPGGTLLLWKVGVTR